MKNLTLIALLTFAVLILSSCNKNDEAPEVKENMSALINGKIFQASTFVMDKAAETTSINGTFGPVSNPESIGFSVKNATVGTFILSEDSENFAVYNSPSDEYISISGTLQITSLSREWIEGNFDFTGRSVNDPSQIIAIVNGKFIIKSE